MSSIRISLCVTLKVTSEKNVTLNVSVEIASANHMLWRLSVAPPCSRAPALDELARPTQRRTLSFYLCLVLAVLPVYSVAPLSFAYVLHSLATLHSLLNSDGWQWSWTYSALFVFCLAEVHTTTHSLLPRAEHCAGFVQPLSLQVVPLNRRVSRARIGRHSPPATMSHPRPRGRHVVACLFK